MAIIDDMKAFEATLTSAADAKINDVQSEIKAAIADADANIAALKGLIQTSTDSVAKLTDYRNKLASTLLPEPAAAPAA